MGATNLSGGVVVISITALFVVLLWVYAQTPGENLASAVSMPTAATSLDVAFLVGGAVVEPQHPQFLVLWFLGENLRYGLPDRVTVLCPSQHYLVGGVIFRTQTTTFTVPVVLTVALGGWLTGGGWCLLVVVVWWCSLGVGSGASDAVGRPISSPCAGVSPLLRKLKISRGCRGVAASLLLLVLSRFIFAL